MEEPKKPKRNNSRLALDEIRVEQLQLIAISQGFKTATGYLNALIAAKWHAMHPDIAAPLPGFDIDHWLAQSGEPIVSFAANGTLPIRVEAEQAFQFAAGIQTVLDGKQNSFFIAAAFDASIDKSVLHFHKKGRGYQFIVMEERYSWKRGLTRSLSMELANLFRFHAEQALQKSKDKSPN